jgi:hypothetical protein
MAVPFSPCTLLALPMAVLSSSLAEESEPIDTLLSPSADAYMPMAIE